MSDQLKHLMPDTWQSPKELLRILSNLLAALFAAQVLGVDFKALGVGWLSPVLPWYATGGLLLGCLMAIQYISNRQEAEKPPPPVV